MKSNRVAKRYLMESPHEAKRLEAKTDAQATLSQLERVGLRRGMRALDAGAATGAVARVMGRMVGPSGDVVALDFSPERVAYGHELAVQEGIKNLRFCEGDVYAPPKGLGKFDFIWSRFLFEYLDRPTDALQSLVGLLKPGGKLVVADIDGHGSFHYPLPPALQESLDIIERALVGRFDPYVGRKLFSWFVDAGLENVQVHLLPYNLYAGAAGPVAISNWEAKMDGIRSVAEKVLGVARFKLFRARFIDFLRAENTLSYSVLFLVEGFRRRGRP